VVDFLLGLPGQCRQAEAIGATAGFSVKPRGINKVIFAGMGGSAIGADIVRCCLYGQCRLPVVGSREYALPACADSATLAFVVSYSGNTEETLSAYKDARARGCRIAALSCGGVLGKLARRDKVDFVRLPAGMPPRCAVGYTSIIPLGIMARLGLIPAQSAAIKETAAVLEGLRDKELGPQVPLARNPAKQAARRLFKKIPLIYAPSLYFEAAASRFKSQLNENAKALAGCGFFPEMTHNEIEGWQNPGTGNNSCAAVFLRDNQAHPRVNRRMEIVSGMLRRQKVEVVDFCSSGRGVLARIFSLIYAADFVSYYLALLCRVDPVKTDKIEQLKQVLSR
jgi:glucose/mannose-6-phosphate isomerase